MTQAVAMQLRGFVAQPGNRSHRLPPPCGVQFEEGPLTKVIHIAEVAGKAVLDGAVESRSEHGYMIGRINIADSHCRLEKISAGVEK